MDSGSTLLTLERGMAVLEVVVRSPHPLIAKVIASRTGLKSSTCYHILRTLRRAGYVRRLQSGEYTLGGAAYSLARLIGQRTVPEPELTAILGRLAARTNETAYLAAWRSGDLVLQEYFESHHTLRSAPVDVGFEGYLHARASGKAVLAFLDRDEAIATLGGTNTVLAKLTPDTISDLDLLLIQLARVRRERVAFDLEEFAIGVCCVAAPYLDSSGQPAGAFTVSAPRERFQATRALLTNAVLEAAAAATSHLSSERYRPLIVVPSQGVNTE